MRTDTKMVNEAKQTLVDTQKNVISELQSVKLSILDLNRLSEIKGLIDSLKSEQKSTVSHLFSRLSDLNSLDIKGLEKLTATQKRVLLLNEIEINLTDDYSIKTFSLIKWYYSSKLSIKKEFITLKNLKSLKKLVKFYTKSSVNNLVSSKSIVTKDDYTKALEAIVNNALSLETLVKNAKEYGYKSEIAGVISENDKIAYDIPTVDYKAVNNYNKECYIQSLQLAIKEA